MRSFEKAALTLFFAAAATPLYAAEDGHHIFDLPRMANFAIVAAALYFAVRKPVAAYLQARTEQIREQLKDAREKSERAEQERQQADALRASLPEEVEKARLEARRAAEAERDRILKAAEAEATRIKEIAHKEIENEVEAGRRKLLARAAELSVSLAHEKLESAMTDEDRARLVDQSIEILGKSK